MLILLTGPIGAGKTTLSGRAVDAAHRCGCAVSGILAPALIENGTKAGIQALDLAAGEMRLLAHTARDLGGLRVGSYSFDDAVLSWVLERCAAGLAGEGLVFVDEIGRLELERGVGLAPLFPLLARPRAGDTLVVVRRALLEPLVERLAPVEPLIVELDPQDRDATWSALAGLLFPAPAASTRPDVE